MFQKGHKFSRNGVRAARGSKVDAREIVFLDNFYGTESPTKGRATESALAAGYSQSTAEINAMRVVRKYGDRSFKDSARAVGINKPYLAVRLKEILELPADKFAKERIAAIRLTMANFGEATDQQGGSTGNTFTGPVMVIVGASQERMKALRDATPQPTREQLEQASNERTAEKLEMLKRGELPPLKRHSVARTIDAPQEPLPNLDNANAQRPVEVET